MLFSSTLASIRCLNYLFDFGKWPFSPQLHVYQCVLGIPVFFQRDSISSHLVFILSFQVTVIDKNSPIRMSSKSKTKIQISWKHCPLCGIQLLSTEFQERHETDVCSPDRPYDPVAPDRSQEFIYNSTFVASYIKFDGQW